MRLKDILEVAPDRELRRAFNSPKSYCHFKVSVFNVGVSVQMVNTDTYRELNDRTWNGYDAFLEKDSYLMDALGAEMERRGLKKGGSK